MIKNFGSGIVLLGLFFLAQQIAHAQAPQAAAAQTAHARSGEFIDLKKAVSHALQNSPGYISSKNQVEAARLELKNAGATFLPSLDLSASHGVRGIEPDTAGLTAETPAVSGATLSLTENFYDNGESIKRYRIASKRHEQATIIHEKAKAQTIRSTVLAYYRFSLAFHSLSFTRKNFDELERLAKLVSQQFYQGLKTRKDFLSFKTRAQRGRLDVINAERELVEARAALLTAIGKDPSANARFDENVKSVVPKERLSTDIPAEGLYEMRALALQQEIGDTEVALARRKFWPQLDLVGAASYGSSAYLDTRETWSDNDVTQWSVLLNLKFNLVDWGTRSRNIQIAAVQQSTAEQNYRGQLFRAQEELETFKIEVERSLERHRLSKELQKMEEDTFKLLERDYRSGQTTYLELTTGLANLLDAQARGQEADYDLADLYLRWKYYKGRLSEETIYE